jgi:hypothetical protein
LEAQGESLNRHNGSTMAEIDKFVDSWIYDVEAVLRRELENLKDQLASEDVTSRRQAESDASAILDWLYLPVPPSSPGDRLKKAQDVTRDSTLTEAERYSKALRTLRSSGRQRGRPRDQTSQHAIRAYTLHLTTGMSWREIALTVKGCKHKRPNQSERSCEHCGDSIRDAVGRLERFLKAKGYHPNVPRRIDLTG